MRCITQNTSVVIFIILGKKKMASVSLFLGSWTNDICSIISHTVVNNQEGGFIWKCSKCTKILHVYKIWCCTSYAKKS